MLSLLSTLPCYILTFSTVPLRLWALWLTIPTWKNFPCCNLSVSGHWWASKGHPSPFLHGHGQFLQPLPQAGQTQVCSAPQGSEQHLALFMSSALSFLSLDPSQAPKHDLTSEYRLQPLPWPPGSSLCAESIWLHWQKGSSSKIHRCRDA